MNYTIKVFQGFFFLPKQVPDWLPIGDPVSIISSRTARERRKIYQLTHSISGKNCAKLNTVERFTFTARGKINMFHILLGLNRHSLNTSRGTLSKACEMRPA